MPVNGTVRKVLRYRLGNVRVLPDFKVTLVRPRCSRRLSEARPASVHEAPDVDRTCRECLEIRQTGIGANGLPVLFNRKPKRGGQPKPLKKPAEEPKSDHADLLDALKGLGLTTTPQAVNEAVAALYPTGLAGIDQGDLVRKVFLRLQGKK